MNREVVNSFKMEDTLVHHGILGQKWGVRRYQNEDGSLTALGKKHVGQKNTAEKRTEAAQKQDAAKKGRNAPGADSYDRTSYAKYMNKKAAQEQEEALRMLRSHTSDEDEENEEKRAIEKAKKLIREIEEALVKEFGETESLKYVKTNRDDDPRKTTFTYISPIDGSKSTFTLTMAGGLASKLKNDLNTASNAKKRTEAAKKQTETVKKQEINQKKEALKTSTKSLTNDKTSSVLDFNKKTEESKLKELKSQLSDIRERISDFDKASTNLKPSNKNLAEIKALQKKERRLESEINEHQKNVDHIDAQKKRLKQSEVISMDDILVHYGVLGMKWGIRRYQNEDGTLTEAGKARVNKKYSQGVKKLKKYDAKIQKLNTKKNKLDERTRKQDYRTNRPKRLLETWNGYEKRTAKSEAKLRSLENKYRKTDWKSEKMYNKGTKWVEKMSKKFSNIELSSVNKDDISYVEEYLSRVMEDKRRPSHNSDRRSSGISSRSSR